MSAPPDDVALRSSRRRAQADEWALVLLAEGLEPSIVTDSDGFVLRVPATQAERATAVLEGYEHEKRSERRPPESAPSLDVAPVQHAALVALGLLAFFGVTGPRAAGSRWFQQGSADADRLLAGEPWRAVTALTLHADLAHVLSNAVVGIVFWSATSRALGPGVALAAIVAAGALGNELNAALRSSPHDSVGASTAVFAAVGILGGLAVVRRRRGGSRGKRVWVPIAASLALLAMLGTAGERVDLWAHGFGLVVGAVLGLGLGASLRHPASQLAQWIAGLGAALAVAGSWILAWR